MSDDDTKLIITANTPVAAAWGFNYYLKYYCNSSVYWSGKNINLNKNALPIVDEKKRIESKD
jgi:alpha-N-acetylglucosaminidase